MHIQTCFRLDYLLYLGDIHYYVIPYYHYDVKTKAALYYGENVGATQQPKQKKICEKVIGSSILLKK